MDKMVVNETLEEIRSLLDEINDETITDLWKNRHEVGGLFANLDLIYNKVDFLLNSPTVAIFDLKDPDQLELALTFGGENENE